MAPTVSYAVRPHTLRIPVNSLTSHSFLLLTRPLWPHGPPYCSLNTFGMLLPQGLCSDCWFFLKYSSPVISFTCLLTCHPERKAILDSSANGHHFRPPCSAYSPSQHWHLSVFVYLNKLECKHHSKGDCLPSFRSAVPVEEPGPSQALRNNCWVAVFSKLHVYLP